MKRQADAIALSCVFVIGLMTDSGICANVMKSETSPNRLNAAMISRPDGVVVEMKFLGKEYQRPPLVALRFDVTLRNHNPQPKWVLLPSKLNLPTGPLNGGVDGLEVLVLPGHGQVVIGKFLGTGGFNALRMLPNSNLTMHNLVIAFWGDLPKDEIVLEIITADFLALGGEAPEVWFGRDPTSNRLATGDASQARIVSSRSTRDNREVKVSIQGEQRISLRVIFPQ